MKFFKNKSIEESQDVILQKKITIVKNDLSLVVEEQVELMTLKYHKQSLLMKIDEKLKLEKYKYPDPDTYKYELLKKIIFYIETIKSLSALLAKILRQSDKIELSVEVKKIKVAINKNMPQLIDKHYEGFYTKYLSIGDGVSGLEREFKEQLLTYEWFVEVLNFYYQNPLQIDQNIPVRWAVRRIKETCFQKVSELIYLN